MKRVYKVQDENVSAGWIYFRYMPAAITYCQKYMKKEVLEVSLVDDALIRLLNGDGGYEVGDDKVVWTNKTYGIYEPD